MNNNVFCNTTQTSQHHLIAIFYFQIIPDGNFDLKRLEHKHFTKLKCGAFYDRYAWRKINSETKRYFENTEHNKESENSRLCLIMKSNVSPPSISC